MGEAYIDKFDYFRNRIVGDAKVFSNVDLGASDVGIARIGRASVIYVFESRDCSVAGRKKLDFQGYIVAQNISVI